MVRDVDAEKMRSALEEGLQPHMRLDATARSFVAQLSEDLKEGDRLIFAFLPGGECRLTAKGREGTPVKSPELWAALQKIWLGPDPISSDIKEKVVERIPGLLK